MGLFSRKKEETETSEEFGKSEDFESEKEELSREPLPVLPKASDKFKQQFPRTLSKLPELPSVIKKEIYAHLPQSSGIQNKNSEYTPSIMSPQSFTPEIHEIRQQRVLEPSKNPPIRESEPIFVKIDKFKDAAENFEQIKMKINEVESMLRKIKDIQEKESQEIKEWEHEVQMIKIRVDNIDNSLFKKL